LTQLFYFYLSRPGQSKDDIGALKTMAAGAVGGASLWISIFPADVIKSRVQIQGISASMFSVGTAIVRDEGVLALYNGLTPTICRTIPATAVLFLVYEYTKKFMHQYL
jgi:solute carrier family 25 ornithine transporter 2/15